MRIPRVVRWPGICLAVFFPFAAACDKSQAPEGPARQGTLVAPAAPSAAASAGPMLTSSPDVDAALIEKQLGCGGAKHKEPCRIVDEFTHAARWTLQIPSGEGRWVGRAYSVEKGADKSDLFMLVARQVPTSTVGPTELPIRIGTGSFPEDKRDAALKLVNALARYDTVPRSNAALAFVKSWSSGNEKGAIMTGGSSVRLVSEQETYIRQGAAQKLLLVTTGKSGTGDGLYAELWPATW
jgi:hypothetical protein